MAQNGRKARAIGPHSRPGVLAIIDGRRAEARLMKAIREDLARHLGGLPSVPQKMLIERCAALSLRLHLLDRETARGGGLSEKNAREYLCWNNSLCRALGQLGLDPTKASLTPAQALDAIHGRTPHP